MEAHLAGRSGEPHEDGASTSFEASVRLGTFCGASATVHSHSNSINSKMSSAPAESSSLREFGATVRERWQPLMNGCEGLKFMAELEASVIATENPIPMKKEY